MNNPVLTAVQVQAAREGGQVRRCHIWGAVGHYDVAQHSYNAVSLLLLLWPDAPHRLIQSLLWHDVAERWLGDLPAPAKWENQGLGKAYEEAEDRVLSALGLSPDLGLFDWQWLRALDTLELWYWSREEVARGNSTVSTMVSACEDRLDALEAEGSLPKVIALLFAHARNLPTGRLPDRFQEVKDVLRKAGARLAE